MILLLFSIVACTTNRLEPTATVETEEKVRWEYKVIQYYDQALGPFFDANSTIQTTGSTGTLVENSISESLQDEINELGSKGWEMVSFTGDGQSISTIMIFKRQLSDD